MTADTTKYVLLGIILLLVVIAVRAINGNRASSTLGAASGAASRTTSGS